MTNDSAPSYINAGFVGNIASTFSFAIVQARSSRGRCGHLHRAGTVSGTCLGTCTKGPRQMTVPHRLALAVGGAVIRPPPCTFHWGLSVANAQGRVGMTLPPAAKERDVLGKDRGGLHFWGMGDGATFPLE